MMSLREIPNFKCLMTKWLRHWSFVIRHSAPVVTLLFCAGLKAQDPFDPFWNVPAPAAGGAVIPSDLSGLAFWVKADAITGLSDNDPVTTWIDSSSLAHDTTQADSGKRPTYQTSELNGKPVVRFDGSDDYLETAALSGAQLTLSANSITIFVVQKQLGSSGNNSSLNWPKAATVGNRLGVFATYDNSIYFSYGDNSGGTISVVQPGGWDDDWKLLELWRSTTSGEIYVDGASILSASFSDDLSIAGTDELSIAGSITSFGGDIAEVFIFNRALNSTERGQMRTYLNTKYAIY